MRVFVISGIRLYCDGLCEILGRRDGIEIAGMAATAQDGSRQLREQERPVDAVIVDVAEPNGLEGLRQVIAAVPGAVIVAITVPEREPAVIACAEAGAAAFVTRDASIDELVQALTGVTRGEAHCSPRMTAALLRRLQTLARPAPPHQGLTRREQEILRLIDAGLSNKMIARQLDIELSTVKNHVHHILDKLKVASRVEAVASIRRRSA